MGILQWKKAALHPPKKKKKHLGKVILRDIWVKYGELNLPLPEEVHHWPGPAKRKLSEVGRIQVGQDGKA